MSRNFELLKKLDREWAIPAVDKSEPDLLEPAGLRPSVGAHTYEELNKLGQRLFLAGEHTSRCVLFTGAAPGVGCSWIAVHTAHVLCSQTTAQVCLVEADGARAGICEHLGIANGAEFTEGPAAADNPLRASDRKVGGNLWVLPVAVGLPSRQRVEAQLLRLRREFDFVLLDAPPVGNSRSLTLGTLADGAVLVLKAGRTPRSAVRLAVEELETAGIKVLGTVLNQREYPIPDTIYKRL
jgi:Mrp family chromosome partitioning ATPase